MSRTKQICGWSVVLIGFAFAGCAAIPGSGSMAGALDAPGDKPKSEPAPTATASKGETPKASAPAPTAALPAPAMTNQDLETEMAAIMQSKWAQDRVLKVVITENDWSVRTNALGYPTTRTIRTAVAVEQKPGNCRFFEVTFEQPAKHKDEFAATQYYSVGATQRIACEATK